MLGQDTGISTSPFKEKQNNIRKERSSLWVCLLIKFWGALRDLFDSMDKTSSSIPPIILLQFLHMAFPQFAEKGDQGQYLQQDANECWVQMMRVLQQKLEGIEGDTVMETDSGATAASSKKKSLIDQFFSIEFETAYPKD